MLTNEGAGCVNKPGSRNVITSRMPFCTQCGNQVGDRDVFCARCGARQASAGAAASTGADPLRDITPRTASTLCYIPWFGWIAAVVVLASPRFHQDRTVRFHAFQGIYIFVAWLLVDWVLSPMFRSLPGPHGVRIMAGLLHGAVLLAWIWMIIKTSQDQLFRLPLLGDLAERSVEEQR